MERPLHRMTLLVTFLALCIGLWACTEIMLSPSDTGVSVNTASTPTNPIEPDDPDTGVGSALKIILNPNTITMNIEGQVVVKVTVVDLAGNEVHTVNLSIAFEQTGIAVVSSIDGRFVTFKGVTAGGTTATIFANGVFAALPITVIA